MSKVSEFTEHVACDWCGSSDARAVYSDGHSYCFACSPEDAYQPAATGVQRQQQFENVQRQQSKEKKVIDLLETRKLTKETCSQYGVECLENGDVVFPYKKAKKYRTPEKEFNWSGYSKTVGLFGQDKFPIGSSKTIIVTEGEYDALAAFQMLAGTVACVSVENGANGALDSFKRQYEYLDSFDKIVIAFDGDEPGKKAAKECADVIPHKTYILHSGGFFKDANDYLLYGDVSGWLAAYKNAEQYKPEGIVQLADILDSLLADEKDGIPWVFPTLTKLTHGRREGELYGFGAGVGMGKTDIFTQSIAYDLEQGLPVGVFYLEQPIKETALRIAGKSDGKIYHTKTTKEHYEESLNRLSGKPLFLFNHFGSKDWETIKQKIVFLAKAYDVKMIYLDHLTALVADEKDERRALDSIMSDMASVAQRNKNCIHFVSHLTTPPGGDSHEEGARVRERDFTGSRAIARWSHFMFGIEGNKNADDKEQRNKRLFRVIKDRYTGQATGESFGLTYCPKSGMLQECSYSDESEVL
jgi:twinkle protein